MHPEDLTDFPADDSPLEDSALTDSVVADGEIAAGEIDDAALRAEIEQLFGAGAFDLLNDDLANIERQVQSNSLEDTVAEIDAAMPQSFHAGITLGADSAVGSARKALLGSDAKHVVFKLGESRYAVPISNVIEIQRVPNVTSIPNVPDWVEGVCNLRGEIISVLDLRSFLSMDGQDFGASRRILVAKSLEQDVVAGLVVDAVVGMRNLPSDQIRQPTSAMDDPVSPFLRGVCEQDGQLLAVIDLERLFASDALRQFEAV